jgi:hypothetical protein
MMRQWDGNAEAAGMQESDRSLSQRFRRRLNFAIQYIEARRRSKLIAKLLPILQSSFNHPWVAEVEIRLRFWPNNETRLGQLWRQYKSMPHQFMNWDAPIAISVFRERRGKKKQALCMSIYLMKDVLYIGQIQGIAGTDAPKELRDWPKIFMECCRTFARQEGLKEVRVPKAISLYSYRNPYVNLQLTQRAQDNTRDRIRRSMQLLYDANAQQLGFVCDGDWFKWQVSE